MAYMPFCVLESGTMLEAAMAFKFFTSPPESRLVGLQPRAWALWRTAP